jgi:hypothetical protein
VQHQWSGVPTNKRTAQSAAKMLPYHFGTAHPQFVNGDGLRIWTVAEHIPNSPLRTAEKGSFLLGVCIHSSSFSARTSYRGRVRLVRNVPAERLRYGPLILYCDIVRSSLAHRRGSVAQVNLVQSARLVWQGRADVTLSLPSRPSRHDCRLSRCTIVTTEQDPWIGICTANLNVSHYQEKYINTGSVSQNEVHMLFGGTR